jgi:hypothetical protein
MKPGLMRRTALCLLAATVFLQASVALAACSGERGSQAEMATMTEGAQNSSSAPDNLCFAHWTADLQLAAVPLLLALGPTNSPVLLIPRRPVQLRAAAGLIGAPPGEPPPRIRLHSFLI